jgi:predicted ester cyclase
MATTTGTEENERIARQVPEEIATAGNGDLIDEADTVAMRVTLRGTHEGEFAGIAPTGKAFEVGNTVVTRIEDGRIVERWVRPDALGLMRQLGVVELPME